MNDYYPLLQHRQDLHEAAQRHAQEQWRMDLLPEKPRATFDGWRTWRRWWWQIRLIRRPSPVAPLLPHEHLAL